MKNKLIQLITLFSITLSSITFASERTISPEPDDLEGPITTTTIFPPIPEIPKSEPDVGEAISPMRKGQIAPFTGLLLSPAAVASVMTDLETKDELIRLEVERATSRLKLNHEHEMTILRIRSESDSKIDKLRIEEQRKDIDRIDAQLKKERESRPDPLVWASIGLGAGVVLSTLTAAIIAAVSNVN